MNSDEKSQLGTDDNLSSHAQGYIEQTEPVSQDTWARERAFFVQAVEEDGLPVNIVSVSSTTKYRAVVMSNTEHRLPAINVTDEKFDVHNHENPIGGLFLTHEKTDDDTNLFVDYYAYQPSPSIDIVYKIPSGKLYRHTLTDYRKPSKISWEYRWTDVLEQLQNRVLLSESHDTIDDISEQNPLSAELNPKSDLSDGKLVIGSESIKLDAESVKTVPRNTSTEQLITFLLQDTCDLSHLSNRYEGKGIDNWMWAHVSDVRENKEDEEVYLTVKTPYKSAVFPFKLGYKTDQNNLWEIIEYAGGDLQNIRGKNFCVRLRGPAGIEAYNSVKQNRVRTTMIRDHTQPIETVGDDTISLFSYDDCTVEPIGIDTDYVWTLGIPNSDKFLEKHIDKTEKSDEGFFKRLIGSTTSP